jgi:hypothetical protein
MEAAREGAAATLPVCRMFEDVARWLLAISDHGAPIAGEIVMGTSRDQSTRVADPLPGLRRQLTEEYGDAIPLETINRVAEQSLGELASAKLRDFVPVFAWRRARQRLDRSA